jgi:hypothetical protein
VDEPGWYGVRCLFRWSHDADQSYEESVSVWRATSFDEAIVKAKAAAREYAATCDGEYLGLAQAFFIGHDKLITDGTEVFSLIRGSDLGSDDYVTRFFDTGNERQGQVP